MKEGEKFGLILMNIQIYGGYHIAFSQSCHHADFMLAK